MSEQKQEKQPAPRKEYVLKKALIQGRQVKQPGEKVMLRADQVERLTKQGVI